ncbi:hypothetical protein [Limosilactobacillus reuteri]|uniref:hypothetical protein n=1 Tax=Limosilactobacillus reuteri TaxID=1598 RepID=UPI00081C0EE1|nr:hypothetical protein [Limosilactobacillus reuteri]MCH5378990.1 hypothetical protein [Limosilactobacillus reuteri]OCW67499.1 hypothetical protein BBP13_09035 [Limosilactobacillus reuteri]OCW69828.1 hypothetical protein BBP14_02325 [Limosilactobacillus reuteri]
MAKDDFDVLEEASEVVGKKEGRRVGGDVNPYRLGTNETKTTRISLELYELIRRIAFEEKRSMLDVTNQMLLEGLDSPMFSNYKKYFNN